MSQFGCVGLGPAGPSQIPGCVGKLWATHEFWDSGVAFSPKDQEAFWVALPLGKRPRRLPRSPHALPVSWEDLASFWTPKTNMHISQHPPDGDKSEGNMYSQH